MLRNKLSEVWIPGNKGLKDLPRPKAVVIAPHPDDCVIGMGGRVADYSAQGHDVLVVYMTDGRGSARKDKTITDDEMVKIRNEEAKKGLEIVGVHDAVFLNYQSSELKETYLFSTKRSPRGDTRFPLNSERAAARAETRSVLNKYKETKTEDVISDLEHILRTLSPEEVFVTSQYEKHPTHQHSTNATIEAIKRSGIKTNLRGYEVWTPINDQDGVEAHDISQFAETKRLAIQAHGSQVDDKAYDDAMLGKNRYNATFLDSHSVDSMQYAELFVDMNDFIRNKRYIGIDVGATWIRVALMDEKCAILYQDKQPTTNQGTQYALSEQLISMIEGLQVYLEDVCGIGVGAAGCVDVKEGVIKDTSNYGYGGQIPIVKPLEERLGVRTFLDNDANVAVRGEMHSGHGKDKDIKNLVYITFSTGIGCGIYVGGRVLEGEVGEAGFFPVEDRRGFRRETRWEACCSGTGIAEYVRKNIKYAPDSEILQLANGDKENITAEHVYQAAQNGDSFALSVLKEINQFNLKGIETIIRAYAPEVIVVGGGVALNNEQLVLGPLRERFGAPKIVLTYLGDDAGLYGAVALVRERLEVLHN